MLAALQSRKITMLMRSTLPSRDHTSPVQDLLIICCLVPIGLAASLGLAVALQPSPDLITFLAQLGG
jgi:hypothetical protein